jgi:hypothetical protein
MKKSSKIPSNLAMKRNKFIQKLSTTCLKKERGSSKVPLKISPDSSQNIHAVAFTGLTKLVGMFMNFSMILLSTVYTQTKK